MCLETFLLLFLSFTFLENNLFRNVLGVLFHIYIHLFILLKTRVAVVNIVKEYFVFRAKISIIYILGKIWNVILDKLFCDSKVKIFEEFCRNILFRDAVKLFMSVHISDESKIKFAKKYVCFIYFFYKFNKRNDVSESIIFSGFNKMPFSVIILEINLYHNANL